MRSEAVFLLSAVLAAGCAAERAASLPLPSGDYTFVLRFAEQPNIDGGELAAEIRGQHIKLINHSASSAFPEGVVDEGNLLWHASSGQWIVAETSADADAADVGGCSDGPAVIDLEQKIYWTC